MEPSSIFIFIYLLASLALAITESKLRKINFFIALIICFLLTPLVGYFIISNRPLRHPVGCRWCGNTQNEAFFCGVCGKNKHGLTKDESENAWQNNIDDAENLNH